MFLLFGLGQAETRTFILLASIATLKIISKASGSVSCRLRRFYSIELKIIYPFSAARYTTGAFKTFFGLGDSSLKL
jgi:hypothetical protein